MKWPLRVVAVLELALILPAALFMAALFVQSAFPPAQPAQELVRWYSARMWTLWVLLLALPCAALVTGCAMLLRSQSSGVIRAHLATFFVAATTLAATVILVIVVLHMAAN
jgi:hypothetical protein